MADGNEWERCAPDDPNRCQASGALGQCRYKAKTDSKYCPRHAAGTDKLAAQAAANQFKLGQYQARMQDFTTNDQLKNLRGEIGILRMTLENTISICKTPIEMVSYAGKIGDLVMKITTVVKTCQLMEVKMGLMLDRDKIMMIGQRIVEIVGEVLPDVEILDTMGEKIVAAILEIADNQGGPLQKD